MTVNNRTIRVLGIIVLILVAVYAITWISAARRTGKHLQDLAGQEPDKVMDALAALRDRGNAVAPRLAELVTAGQPEAAPRAAWLLGMIGSHAGDAQLLQAVQAPDPMLRIAAMQALGQLRAESAVPVLSGVLSNQSEKSELRVAAAYALGDIGQPGSVTVLIAALGERPKPEEPAAAVVAAPAAPAPPPPPDTALPVRIAAARALGLLRQSSSVDALVLATSKVEPSPEVRLAAANALGDAAAVAEDMDVLRKAVGGLLPGLEDESGDVRVACVYSLGKVSPPEDMMQTVTTAVNKAKDNPGYWTRRAAARSALLLRLPE